MEPIKIKLYRHKDYKNVYLVRNWNIQAGNVDTEFFFVTDDIFDAISNVQNYTDSQVDLEQEIKKYFYENGHSLLKTEMTMKREMEFDGYKGTLTKVISLSVDDFEPFYIGEIENE